MRIVLFARSLGLGGAERQIALMAVELARRHAVTVATLYPDEGHYDLRMRTELHVADLGKRSRWDVLRPAWRYVRLLRASRADVVYAFLAGPSLLSVAARVFAPRTRVVWGVRATRCDFAHYGAFARFARGLEARLSRFADAVISNSDAGRADAIEDGFRAPRFFSIANGVDVTRFRPDPGLRAVVRAELGVGTADTLFGCVARLDPMKGHEFLLRAFAALRRERRDAKLVLVGGGERPYVDSLRALADGLGVAASVIWVGAVRDPARFYPAFDTFVLASIFGEGFSNAIGEAMASGVPCVATSIGDSSRLIGECGRTVPAGDDAALSRAMLEMCRLPASELGALGAAARRRVELEFSVDRMIERTERSLEELIS